MMKLLSKRTYLTLFICCITFIAKAQLGFGFSHYDAGFGAGFNNVYGDELPQKTTPSVNLTLSYNQTPFVNFVFEAQFGRMAGGDSTIFPGRQFTSNFSSFIFRGQLQAGELVNYSNNSFLNGLKNFYISAGIGYAVTHITNISRNPAKGGGLYVPGENDAQEPFLPIRIGYEFKFFNKFGQPSFKLDLGYGYNYVFGDELDGYNYGKYYDAYAQFSIGVKFAIGSEIVSYRKQIQY